MHVETVKFVNAEQAKLYNIYKNTKLLKRMRPYGLTKYAETLIYDPTTSASKSVDINNRIRKLQSMPSDST
jgi:hypothetical protein